MRRRRLMTAAVLLAGLLVALPAGVFAASTTPRTTSVAGAPTRAATAPPGRLLVVGAESQYANLLAAVGGPAVRAVAVMDNPNADPHSFEVSPSIARLVSSAALVVQNGLGYDAFMNHLEAASPSRSRRVLVVQRIVGAASGTQNPHLWYRLDTFPRVAAAIARALAKLRPADAAAFAARATAFDRRFGAVRAAAAALRTSAGGAPVAVSEPVADDLVRALGLRDRTPWRLQAAVMNGFDPAPQDVAVQESLLADHKVRAFLYNAQVKDSITAIFLQIAESHHVPIVAVYETLPAHHDDVSWMLAEIRAIALALRAEHSTRSL